MRELILLSLLVHFVYSQSGFPGFPAPALPNPADIYSHPYSPTNDPNYQAYAPYIRPVQPPPTIWNPTPDEFRRSWDTAVADPQTLFNGDAIKAGTPEPHVQEQRYRDQRDDDRNTFSGFVRHAFGNYHPSEYTAPPPPHPSQFGQVPQFPGFPSRRF